MSNLCARDGDRVTVRSVDVRSPSSRRKGAAGCRTVTLSPQEASLHSKTKEVDLAKAVAQPNRERAWMAEPCPLLLKLRPASGLLPGLTQCRWLELFNLSKASAQVGAAVPHRPRHGSASMNARTETSDEALMERGLWGSPPAVSRHRKPGRCIKQLSLLTPEHRRQCANSTAQIMQKILKLAASYRSAHGSSFHGPERTHLSSLMSGVKGRTSLSPRSATNS